MAATTLNEVVCVGAAEATKAVQEASKGAVAFPKTAVVVVSPLVEEEEV